jgi:hypothetical protein
MSAFISILAFTLSGISGLGVTESYDRIRDETVLRAYLGTIYTESYASVDLSLSRHWSGKGRGRNTSDSPVMLYFRGESTDSWQYLKYHEIVLLFDDHRVRQNPEHDGDVKDGRVVEHLFVHLYDQDFQKMAAAKVIEGKIGLDQFRLSPRQMQILKEFCSYVNDPKLEVKSRPKFEYESVPTAQQRPRLPSSAEMLKSAQEYEKAGWLDAARSEYRYIIDFYPHSPEAKLAAASLPELEAKIADKLKKGKAGVLLNLGRNLEKSGKIAAAVGHYRDVVGSYPGTPEAKAAQERINVLTAK